MVVQSLAKADVIACAELVAPRPPYNPGIPE
jgi:hypothetical protein